MSANFSQNILEQCDRTFVLISLATFSGKQPSNWLGTDHPARDGQLPKSWTDTISLSSSQLIEAVAASAPAHCTDGWSYIARAISSLMAGDAHASRHLAYYSQLRAAMSILANLGIGIFNGNNFIITKNGSIERLDIGAHETAGAGTHSAVWAALSIWLKTANAGRQFLNMIRIKGIPLLDCLESVWPGSNSTPIASSFIRAWGLDLERGAIDHSYRNISSYTPQVLNPLGVQVLGSMRFLSEIWRMLEPASIASFDNLDRFLLRSILQKQHRLLYRDNKFHRKAIAERYEELPHLIRFIASKDFLTGKDYPEDPLLVLQAQSDTKPAGPVDMIARSIMMLRAATAFTNSSLSDAGVQGKMKRMTSLLGHTRGFYPSNDGSEDPISLWEEVEYALIALEDCISKSPHCYFDWLRQHQTGLPTITEMERAAIWGLSA